MALHKWSASILTQKRCGGCRLKAARAAVSLQLDQGVADELPYKQDSFDRVFSSFMFHHLNQQEQENMLREYCES